MRHKTVPRRAAAAAADAGFSLIETIVALTLLAAMLAMVPGTLRLASRAWQAQDGIDRIARITRARATLTQLLGHAMPLAGSGTLDFTGAPDALAFVAPAPQSAASAGLVAYRLQRVETASARGRGDLVMTMTERTSASSGGEPQSTAERRAVILEDVRNLSLRYFGAPEGGGSNVWQSEWRERARLPDLIEVSITIPGAAGPQREVLVVEPHLRAGR